MKIFASADQRINDQLAGFVFDEEKVLHCVSFSQFVTKQGELGVGLLLPKEVTDDKGNVTQHLQPVVVTSARSFHPVFRGENRALGVRFESIPAELPRRYSLVSVPRWLHAADPAPDPRALFEDIKQTYEEFLCLREPWYAVHACWDLATYFHQLFPAFPYMELRGLRSVGKTKLMSVSRCFSFHASSILTSPSEASLFRMVHDQRPTLYLDECEGLFRVTKGRVEHDGRVEILNSGYTADGSVPRVEKVGTKFVTVIYKTYCPKMLASIAGLHGATESRAIVHIMTRAPGNDPRGEREPDPRDPRWQEIRDHLFQFMLGRWREVNTAFDSLSDAHGLKQRDLQLWRPLLAVAALIGEDVKQTILDVARQQQELNQGEEVAEGSWEFHLLSHIHNLLKGGQRLFLFRELQQAIPGDEKPSARAIRTLLDRYGFRERWRHTRDGNGYELDQAFFQQIIAPVFPSLFTFTSSQGSQEAEFEDLRNYPVKECEGRGGPVKEAVKIRDSRERVFEGEGLGKTDLLAALQQLQEPQPVEGLQLLFPGLPVPEWLGELALTGDVYESRAGFWGCLR